LSWIRPKWGGYEFRLNIFYSLSFKVEVGTISGIQSFGSDHPMTTLMNDFLAMTIGEHTFEARLTESGKEIIVEVWKHNYSAFALVTPKQ
jgi:hypothetical protein